MIWEVIDAVLALAYMVASIGCLVYLILVGIDAPSPPTWLLWIGLAAAFRAVAKAHARDAGWDKV